VALVTPGVAVATLVLLAGLGLVGAALWSLSRIAAARWSGAFIYADDGRSNPPALVSDEHGLVGRPDEVWRRSDGSLVPVEVKSRRAPDSGVLASHRVQVEAYCLILESTSGRSPPYGVVVYADRVRRTVPWDDRARREVRRLLSEIRRPYDGRAAPSLGKCRGCRWREGCDVRTA